METINKTRYFILLDRYCNKGKHRFSTNKFGVTWCTICGQLSTALTDDLQEGDKMLIVDDD